jgi:hypothetical protein
LDPVTEAELLQDMSDVVFAVCSLTTSYAAISWFDSPQAI